MSVKKYNIGIVPGSFDPITVGHLDIIKRASELCDKIYVAVMINDQKKYMFSLEERKDIAAAAVADVKNAEVISSSGMLWELALELQAEAIIKGVRNETDRAYELEMEKYNSAHNPNARTVLLDAAADLYEVSSTLIRKMIEEKKSLDGYVPEGSVEVINKIINGK